MSPEEFFLVSGLAVSVIDRPELAVGGGVLHHKRQLRNPGIRLLYGGMGGVSFLRHSDQSAFQFSIAVNAMLRQEIHGLGGLFQIIKLRPMGEPGALLCPDVILDINEQADLSVTLFWLPGRSGASDDPGGNGFLRVVYAQGFHPGKPFLVGGPAGNVLAPLDFVSFPLQAEQQIFKVGGGRDQPVNGRFQFRLITGSGLGRLVFNVALAFVFPRDDDG